MMEEQGAEKVFIDKASGKNEIPKDIPDERIVLHGNCTRKYPKDHPNAYWILGCPPNEPALYLTVQRSHRQLGLRQDGLRPVPYGQSREGEHAVCYLGRDGEGHGGPALWPAGRLEIMRGKSEGYCLQYPSLFPGRSFTSVR